jgi:DNA-binding MarR family transcriptional regulator
MVEPRKMIKREGIKPRSYQGRTVNESTPLTERHKRILRMVDIEDPIKPGEIAEVLGLKRDGVVSSLYALQDRGLVERVPFKGWRKSSK